MGRYRVRNDELRWFGSYLSGRKQFCKVNAKDSQINAVDSRVPQGSCLGPLLFLVYINDLPKVIENCNAAMYADDTGVYLQSATLAQLNKVINKDLESLDHWPNGNKLSLKVVKTFSINILTLEKSQKLLGELDLNLQIDRDLTWKKQVDISSRKVPSTI